MEERELELPELPFSPYLYTKWVSPTEWVSRTMYADDAMRAYGAECARQAVLAERESLLLRVDNVMTGAGIGKADRDYILERLKSPAR